MGDRDNVTIAVTLPTAWVRNLQALVSPEIGIVDVAGVLEELADHAQQAVYRPGAWEREWLCQAFGYEWLDYLEPDPQAPDIYQRPRHRGDR
jgi:hypothetical protein